MSAVFSLISLLKLHSFTGQVYALTFFFWKSLIFLKRTLEISFTQQVTGLLFAEQLASLHISCNASTARLGGMDSVVFTDEHHECAVGQ